MSYKVLIACSSRPSTALMPKKDMRDIGDAIIKQWDDGNAPVKVVASEVVIAREKTP